MQGTNHDRATSLPGWVPQAAIHYIEHTEAGTSLRALARASGCHPSTILRQVRKIETRRDDPLVDAALDRLGQLRDGGVPMSLEIKQATGDPAGFQRETQRILQRLCEAGAVLAVAEGMEKAVVVRDQGEGGSVRTAVVDAGIAEAMALRDWIHCDAPGRVSRYRITPGGRQSLNQMMAGRESRLRGFAESQAGYGSGAEIDAQMAARESAPARTQRRFSVSDSPLAVLARRKTPEGSAFLSAAQVVAGERLREDFELSGIAAEAVPELLARPSAGPPEGTGKGTGKGAETRFLAAIRALGPGLADVAVQCCCLLEGLETTEKRMGWSARSGKIVLRIALERLSWFYRSDAGRGSGMIG
ncbi:hypothetical protein FIU97_10030 [Roseivivax sp. THAF40]|uniref:DUF6456 domain-containing protein n=1 Tax=unclassified Roseivivax TaxID=2639302 RepID=UPI0012681130|nr:MULTISPECIES: DUF6456 domain-containing protein [unclassified Roseivivax]QFS83165.1 hypothetical protein FIV09_10045 [Roseivivax sp. THAF197b]QFT46909.1 hypothetical protein FIU97_10030 [Roseivivax sp. THAF40]